MVLINIWLSNSILVPVLPRHDPFPAVRKAIAENFSVDNHTSTASCPATNKTTGAGQKDKREAKLEDRGPDLTGNTNESKVKPRRDTNSKRSAATQESPAPKRRKRWPFTSPPFFDDSAEEEPQILFILDGNIVKDRIKESFGDRGRPHLQ
jgi:hypothetical protein